MFLVNPKKEKITPSFSSLTLSVMTPVTDDDFWENIKTVILSDAIGELVQVRFVSIPEPFPAMHRGDVSYFSFNIFVVFYSIIEFKTKIMTHYFIEIKFPNI